MVALTSWISTEDLMLVSLLLYSTLYSNQLSLMVQSLTFRSLLLVKDTVKTPILTSLVLLVTLQTSDQSSLVIRLLVYEFLTAVLVMIQQQQLWIFKTEVNLQSSLQMFANGRLTKFRRTMPSLVMKIHYLLNQVQTLPSNYRQ